MSNANRSEASKIGITLAFAIQMLLCFPLAAGASPAASDQPCGALPATLQIAAIAPSATAVPAPGQVWMHQTDLRRKLDEVRDILQELLSFADTAQRAIQMGRKIKALRLENKRLKRDLAEDTINEYGLEANLAKAETEGNRLTGTVVANWLTSIRVDHQSAVDESRLTAAKAAFAQSDLQLASLRREVAKHRSNARDLRAKSAALAVEIGRMRRQIANVKRETRLTEDERLAIETTIMQLRHEVSAGLRTMLVAD